MSYDTSTSNNYYSSNSNRYDDKSSHSNSYSNSSPQRDSYREDEERPAQNFEYSGPIDFDKYEDIPVETSGRDCPRPIAAWRDVEIGSAVLNNIEQAGYKKPTPVQKYSLPIVIAGRDLMGCAQTGSGKTAAFLLPIIAQMLKRGPNRDPPRDNKAYPRALILAPTRELAVQIHEEARKFSNRSGIRSVVVYGGSSISYQLRDLTRGTPDILVATPGRLVDIIERGNLSMTEVRFLVLDEADRMLDMGFEPQIRRIVERERMPPKGDRQTLMFSATFPHEIQSLAASFLNDYVFLTVGRVGSAAELVTQKFLHTPTEADKEEALQQLLQGATGLTLIFVETKKKASMLDNMLRRRGFKTTSIHGDRSQAERTAALKSFSTGVTPFLIATNVAARGLDISNVTHVINFEMPTNIDDYVHRVGRTGRAGKSGVSTAFLSEKDGNLVGDLLKVLKDGGQTIPPWLEGMHRPYGNKRSFGGGGGNRFNNNHHHNNDNNGGHRFGGRDFRQHNNNNTHSHNNNNGYNNNRDASSSSGSSWFSSASSSYGANNNNSNTHSNNGSTAAAASNWVPLQPLNTNNTSSAAAVPTNSYLPPNLNNNNNGNAANNNNSNGNGNGTYMYPQPPVGFYNQLAPIVPVQPSSSSTMNNPIQPPMNNNTTTSTSNNTHTGDRGYKRSYSPSSSSSSSSNRRDRYESSSDDHKKYRRDNNNSGGGGYDDRNRRDDSRRDDHRSGDRDSTARRDGGDRDRDSRRDDRYNRDNNNNTTSRRSDGDSHRDSSSSYHRDSRDSSRSSSYHSSSSRDSRDNYNNNNRGDDNNNRESRDSSYRRDNRDGDSSYRR